MPEDVEEEGQEEGDGEEDTQPAKKPALSSSFSFRPSPLQKATQGLILRQSTLAPPSSTSGIPLAKPFYLSVVLEPEKFKALG